MSLRAIELRAVEPMDQLSRLPFRVGRRRRKKQGTSPESCMYSRLWICGVSRVVLERPCNMRRMQLPDPIIRSRKSLYFCLALAATILCCFAPASQAQRQDLPGLGDSPSDAGPLAKDLSPALKKKDVAHALRKVADWQLPRVEKNYSLDWTFAALYAGFMAVPPAVHGNTYQDAMRDMGKQFNWQLGPRPEHADDHAVGQTYLELYEKSHDAAMLAPTRERMDTLLQRTDDPAKPLWWWCDALFMAPPVLADLSKITGDAKYLHFMDREWWITSKLLYDPQLHLYSRDASFLDKKEANGAKVFWSRGNGWVMGGLVRVLSTMPANDPARQQYVTQFQQMSQALAAIQGADGLWRPGLLNAEAYKLPEVSGSAFITYAMAWGVRNGLLDRKQYLPVVEKAWKGLLTHVYQDGRLGCIQPIGAAPGAFTPTSSYVFGVGAFLMAGSEMYELSK